MKVGFTGHRDKTANETELLELIQSLGATHLVHGGAIGFDQQVGKIAGSLPTTVIKPDYSRHGKGAPLVRNKEIVGQCDCLVACWDGRETGGTWFTINFAKTLGIPIHYVSPR